MGQPDDRASGAIRVSFPPAREAGLSLEDVDRFVAALDRVVRRLRAGAVTHS